LRRARGKTYEAGAKLDWHSHPGGQVLLITEGAGYYQERRKPVQRPEGILTEKFLPTNLPTANGSYSPFQRLGSPRENVSR
jgi:hypothetical protein